MQNVHPWPRWLLVATRYVAMVSMVFAAGLAQGDDDRATEILKELDSLDWSGDTVTWCARLQELVELGEEAVPVLCADLDRTENDFRRREMGFVLRAIGDKRAVPALIRALPRTLVPPNSDYGHRVEDEDLQRFMAENDLDETGREGGFSYGRSVREILGALHKLTGQDFDDEVLNHVHRRQDRHGERIQRELFHRQAKMWSDWWEQHASEFTADKALQEVRLPPLPPGPAEQPRLTGKAKIESSVKGWVLSPRDVAGKIGRQFLDLDTGALQGWPKMIKQPKTGAEPQELLAWIERQGHDLTCVVHKGEDGVEWYVLRAWGMRVWEIDPALAKMGQDVAGVVDVPEREPGSELLIHRDPKTKRIEPEIPATFLCQTREGGFVIVEIEQQITRVLTEKDFVAGLPSLPANSGFALGVKFNTYPIALEVVEVPPGE